MLLSREDTGPNDYVGAASEMKFAFQTQTSIERERDGKYLNK